MSSSSTLSSLEEVTSTSTEDKIKPTKFPINKGRPNMPDDDPERSEEEEEEESETSPIDETDEKTKNKDNGSAVRKKRMTMPLIYQLYQSKNEDVRGTVIGPSIEDFHPEKASEMLRQALNGLDTNEGVIIAIVAHHNNFQRQGIMNAYEDRYSRKLMEDLEDEIGGFFLDLVLALLIPAHIYSANLLYKSLNSRKRDRAVAVEIACTRSTMQMKAIKNAYQTTFRSTVEHDIKVKVQGIFGKMLNLLLCSSRDEQNRKVDMGLVEEHVELINKEPMGFENIAHNIALFEQIFIGNSWAHIAAIINYLDTQPGNGYSMESHIRRNKNIRIDTRNMLLTIVKVSQNAQLYFAEKLHEALSGLHPDHNTITRIVVTRSEIDLLDICEEYKRRYKRRLVLDIQKTCTGEYSRLLVTLLSGESTNSHVQG